MEKQFWDATGKGFFFTSSESEELLVREKQTYDGAIPAGNSAAAVQLLKLGHLTGNTHWLNIAEDLQKLYKTSVYGRTLTL
jgi:uncharacterized protein YyaL (SSP411 family)